MELQRIVNQEMKEIETYITQLEKRQTLFPEGKLNIRHNGNSVQYIQRVNPKEKSGRYIKRREEKLVRKLAQKEYEAKALSILKKHYQGLQAIGEESWKDEVRKIYDELLELAEDIENADKCIFIIEDSQLDIGLLIAVERNVNRIFQIISDYLTWNDEKIAESLRKPEAPAEEKISDSFDVYAEDEKPEKKKGLFGRIGDWFKKTFKKKNKKGKDETNTPDADSESEDGLTPKQRRKAEKEAKKAARKAAKEEKKKQRQEEKLRKQQEKEAKKEAESTKNEPPTEENADAELPVEETTEEEVVVEETATSEENENIDETSVEETATEEISPNNEEEVSEDE